MSLKTQLDALKTNIADYCKRYDRDPASITLVAVSKTQSIATLEAAIAAGQTIFGENYLQEALPKIAHFKKHNLEWHFIGAIQSNKTKAIAENFSWVHTIDRRKIADQLNAQRPAELGPLNVCLQIKLDDESQKAGLSFEAARELYTHIQTLPQLKLRGLMAIPKPGKSVAAQRESFKTLRVFAESLGLRTLSRGMSQDYEAAIAEGSTLLRLGTAIFGPRL